MSPSQSGILVEEAFSWASRLAKLRPSPLQVDPADKFIIRSNLQKSVRRGQLDRAADLALRLHRLDARSCWRAVLTIALEDVGFGSPDSVLWATLGQSPGFRRLVGEVPLLLAITGEMCRALKSRAACELSFIVDIGEPKAFEYFGRLTTAKLLSYVEARDPYEMYLALSVLRGVTPPGLRFRPPDPAGTEQACEIIAERLPANWARAACAALRRPLDNMSLATAPAWCIAHEQGELSVVWDVMPESCTLSGYASEAYDQHERVGRQAIRKFAKRLRDEHPEIGSIPIGVSYAATADAVFIEEGQCLDRWAGGGDLTRLREEADGFSLARHGLSDWQGRELRQVVRDNLGMLNDRRRDLLTNPKAI